MFSFVSLWIVFQMLISLSLILPFFLYLLRFFTPTWKVNKSTSQESDYAIIVTAYEQISLLPSVVDSILTLEYENFLIYIVADNCDTSNLVFEDDRVIVLSPQLVLASNTKSHLYAIDNFQRAHSHITIIDSDNLVQPTYLKELDKYFGSGFIAVQGVRKAKNLNTIYACLDEAGDMYYRYTDRKLLFEVGSSASLAGSGMAFRADFYSRFLQENSVQGAGFDKVLQMEILKKGHRIAFAESAVVFDEKTSMTQQLVNQRARWINTWFRYVGKGLQLIGIGMLRLNWNQFLCGLIFARPPLFISLVLSIICMIATIFINPYMLWFWVFSMSAFLFIVFTALKHFKAHKAIYTALYRAPIFMFYQIISLFRAKGANKRSTATKHYVNSKITDV